MAELIALNRKVAILSDRNEYLETPGWISDDDQMIRSPGGAVWIQIVNDMSEEGMDIPPGMDKTTGIGEDDEIDVDD